MQCHGVVCADPAWLVDQESTAGQYLLLLLEITATRAWSMSLNTTCCPGIFAAVLHPTAAVSAMLHIKATYDIIKKAEALAIGPRPHMLKNTLIKVLDDVAFHRWQFVLEFWARAARSNWALTEELCYMAWSTNALVANTKYVLEDKFSHLRRQERTWNSNYKMNQWHIYSAAVSNPTQARKDGVEGTTGPSLCVQPEDYNVPLPTAASDVTTKIFTAWQHKVDPETIDTDALREQRSGHPDASWTRAGQQALHRSASAVMLLRLAAAEDFKALDHVWAGAHHYATSLRVG